jgi:hypothetical protein
MSLARAESYRPMRRETIRGQLGFKIGKTFHCRMVRPDAAAFYRAHTLSAKANEKAEMRLRE